MATGCYVDPYIPCSFKGISFQAMEITSEHGRRGAEGEFPFGENTAYADLGRKIRVYTVRGRFAANSHIDDASLLIAVCESPGPGLLLHPTRGPVVVACRSIKVTDDALEGQGVTYVDLDFVEANDWISGFVFSTLLFGFSLAAIIAAASESFTANYEPAVVRSFRQNEVTDLAASVVDQIAIGFGAVTVGNTDNKVARANYDLAAVTKDPFTLRDPDTTLKSITLGMAAIDRFSSGERKFNQFRKLANFAAQDITAPDEAGDAQNAVLSLTRILAAGYMARGALESEPRTLGDALLQYDQVMAILDGEIAVARDRCDNNLHIELRKFQTQVQTALLNRAYNLPALIEYVFSSALPSLVIAYQLFNDAKRFVEIEERNPTYWPHAIGPRVIAANA